MPLLSLFGIGDEVQAGLATIAVPGARHHQPRRTTWCRPSNSDILADAGRAARVERVMLERSYHVATLDHDKDLIEAAAVEFALKVTRLTARLEHGVRGAVGVLPTMPAWPNGSPATTSRTSPGSPAWRSPTTSSSASPTQLAAMLEHAADVDALDIADVPPTAHPLPARATCCAPTSSARRLDRDEVLAAAPAAEDGRFRVPPILGEAP